MEPEQTPQERAERLSKDFDMLSGMDVPTMHLSVPWAKAQLDKHIHDLLTLVQKIMRDNKFDTPERQEMLKQLQKLESTVISLPLQLQSLKDFENVWPDVRDDVEGPISAIEEYELPDKEQWLPTILPQAQSKIAKLTSFLLALTGDAAKLERVTKAFKEALPQKSKAPLAGHRLRRSAEAAGVLVSQIEKIVHDSKGTESF